MYRVHLLCVAASVLAHAHSSGEVCASGNPGECVQSHAVVEEEISVLQVSQGQQAKLAHVRAKEVPVDDGSFCCWWPQTGDPSVCSECVSKDASVPHSSCQSPGVWCGGAGPAPFPPTPSPLPLESELEACLRNPLPSCGSECEVPAQVVLPTDTGFVTAKAIHNHRTSEQVLPRVIVFASAAEQVVQATRCAAMAGVSLYARSGGNIYEYMCDNACVLVDVSNIKNVTFEGDQAVLGPGLSLGEAYKRLADNGWVIPAGTCAQVRVAGLTLGGGKGRLTRLLGFTIDKLLGVDVVLFNGTRLYANASHNDDLFWAARGGGGNVFPGIVLALRFQLSPVPTTAASFSMEWPIDRGVDVLEYWSQNMVMSPYLGLHARIVMQDFGSSSVQTIVIQGSFVGEQSSEVNNVMTAATNALGPTVSPSQPKTGLTWLDIVLDDNGLSNPDDLIDNCGWDLSTTPPQRTPCHGYDWEWEMNFKYRSLVISGLGRDAAQVLVDHVRSVTWTNAYVQIDPSNGKAGEVPSNATVYPWRGPAESTLQIVSRWDGPTVNVERQRYNYETIEAMMPLVGKRAYYNYLDYNMPSGAVPFEAYYGDNGPRLASIVTKYDPNCTRASVPELDGMLSCNRVTSDPNASTGYNFQGDRLGTASAAPAW